MDEWLNYTVTSRAPHRNWLVCKLLDDRLSHETIGMMLSWISGNHHNFYLKPLRWRLFAMADLCYVGPLRWRPFAMADRNRHPYGALNTGWGYINFAIFCQILRVAAIAALPPRVSHMFVLLWKTPPPLEICASGHSGREADANIGVPYVFSPWKTTPLVKFMLAATTTAVPYVSCPVKKTPPCDIYGYGGGLHMTSINTSQLLEIYGCYFVCAVDARSRAQNT